jgi:hypothetical protein
LKFVHPAWEKSGPFVFWDQSGCAERDALPAGLRVHALGTVYRPSDPSPDGRIFLVFTHVTHLVIPKPQRGGGICGSKARANRTGGVTQP